MKKVLLINPPVSIYINKTAFLPLPLLVLGTCLKKIKEEGFDFSYEIVDLDLMLKQGFFSDDSSFYQEAGNLILGKKPDILLFTVHGVNHIVVLKLSERIKNEQRSCVIVVGGVGPTLMAKEALTRCEHIDIIVKGEGETVLKHLIPAILTDRNYSDVPSAVYRKDGQIMENPRRRLGNDEPIAFPNYSLVHIEDYIVHNKKNPYIHPGFVPIESGRGCPYRCSFCAPAKMWESTARYRSISEIIEEMKFLAGKGGDFSFLTQDNLEEKFLIPFSEALIKENVNISWGSYSRLDRLSDNMAGLLSKAGCRLIFTGFETPNRSAQKSIRKVVNSSATFQKLQSFNANGISLIGSFIAGFLDESEEDIDSTMRFALECATGLKSKQLNQFVAKTDHDKLPPKGANICVIHPLSHMPGTDSFEIERENLHISRYSLHPDCYGSFLFSYDEFKNDWSFLGANPYLNHLPEEKVRFYCSILRLFNLLNSRPYYFALLLSKLEQSPLTLMKNMVADLGEEFVLTAKIDAFEEQTRDYVSQHLEFVPQWTVKKGQ
ncbi:MAG: radical SAM protein [Syntrophaceae bacterium]